MKRLVRKNKIFLKNPNRAKRCKSLFEIQTTISIEASEGSIVISKGSIGNVTGNFCFKHSNANDVRSAFKKETLKKDESFKGHKHITWSGS